MDRRRMIRAAVSASLAPVLRPAGLVRIGLPAFSASFLAGCFGGAGDSPHTWWELEAPAGDGRAEPDAARSRLSLVVEGMAAGVLYDGATLLYSRAPGVRSSYQFASWTERPAARLARLARRRLQERGGFRDVSTAESGVAPDLLLTLTIEGLFHDLTVEPGVQRVQVAATLNDWHRRRPIASRRFEAVEPVESEDAAGAAAAAGRAVGRLLDELAPWVEENALGIRRESVRERREGRPAGGEGLSDRRQDLRLGSEGSVDRRDGSGPAQGYVGAGGEGGARQGAPGGSGSIGAAGSEGASPGFEQAGGAATTSDNGAGAGLEAGGAGSAGAGPDRIVSASDAALPGRRIPGKRRPPGYSLSRDARTTAR